MVTKKKMTVPIFDYRLTILIYDSWDEVSYLFDSGPEPLAITRFQYGAALVAVNSRRGSSIIHEAEHIKNNIWEYIGYRPQRDNDEIDAYVITYIYNKITDEQKNMLFQDEDYVDTYNKLQSLVQAEILSLVKGRIEGTQEGKDLLTHQLKIVKKLKGKIIDTTNKEMEMFRRFREFSKSNPNVTYEEFIKANM